MRKKETFGHPGAIPLLDGATLGTDLDFSPLKELGELRIHDLTPPGEVLSRCAGASTVITNKVRFDRPLLEALPDLRLLALTATGYNNVDLKAAEERGVAVCNVAGYSTESVAQHTFAMAFYLMEQLRRQDDFVRSGEYSRRGVFTWVEVPWRELAACRWGIIGLGAIGKKVASLARSFGAEVVYYSTSGANRSEEHHRTSLEELLKTSDIVSIHAPLNEKTQGLLSREELALMKDSSFLLNLGRGGIVDEEALVEALDRGRPRGAGLDVMEKEPLPADSPLLTWAAAQKAPRLLLTPHSAWGSRDARQRLLHETALNIQSFRQGESRNRII